MSYLNLLVSLLFVTFLYLGGVEFLYFVHIHSEAF